MKKIIVVCLVILMGCASMLPAPKYWTKTDYNYDMALKDQRECIYEGQKMKAQVEGSGKGLQGYNDGNYALMVTTENCMVSRGYYLTATPTPSR